MSDHTDSENMKTQECEICMENMGGKGKLRAVECLSCQTNICRSCCERYLLDQNRTARCMVPSCKKDWPDSFLSKNFTRSFLNNKYKKHLEQVFYDIEKSLLPATQEIAKRQELNEKENEMWNRYYNSKREILVEHEKKLKEFDNKVIIKRSKENKDLPVKSKHWNWIRDKFRKDWYEKKYSQSWEQERQMNNFLLKQNRQRYRNEINYYKKQQKKRKNNNNFVRACTQEGCKGFFNSNWECGLCDRKACCHCHATLREGEEHICNPDDKATAQMIMKESKPCPGCKINITKIDGCDQMWCTNCKTAWDWKSGEIQTKVHNPHFFEYLRNTAVENLERNPLETRCGREMDDEFAISFSWVMKRVGFSREKAMKYLRVCERLVHTREMDLMKYATTGETPDNVDLRVNFLRNKISEQEFKRRVQMAYKKNNKNKEIRDILSMFIQVATEILYKYRYDLDHCTNIEDACKLDLFNQLEGLEKYARENLLNMAFTYNSTNYIINITNQAKGWHGLVNYESYCVNKE